MDNDKINPLETENNISVLKAKPGKYLTFELGQEVYGLEILKVQEIIGMMKVTHVPRTPPFIRGVINLRGKVIPVIDLRLKFGLDACIDTEKTCIIVLQINFQGKQIIMGILVDEVSEVININKDQIEDPPSFGSTIDIEFIMGMGKVGKKVIMLLDVDKVLSITEITSVSKIGKE